MDQVQIGRFLKTLRKERQLTQERLAEQLNVSNRSISRWETGSSLPDIGMLIELADFYGVSISEIIDGERKNENMDSETKETARKVAEYTRSEAKVKRRLVIGTLLVVFGLFLIMSALAIFPADSSWGCNYSILGSIVLLIGLALIVRSKLHSPALRVGAVVGCAVLLFGVFTLSDYLAVTKFNSVPRFCYQKGFNSEQPDQIVYKTLFFTAVQTDPGTEQEQVWIQ